MWTRLISWWSRLRSVTDARALDRDLRAELSTHLVMATEDLIRRGVPPADAARQARLRLGGIAQLEETHRAARGLPQLELTMHDLRFSFRTLARNRIYAVVAIATLAVGIGAGTAVFSIARA